MAGSWCCTVNAALSPRTGAEEAPPVLDADEGPLQTNRLEQPPCLGTCGGARHSLRTSAQAIGPPTRSTLVGSARAKCRVPRRPLARATRRRNECPRSSEARDGDRDPQGHH